MISTRSVWPSLWAKVSGMSQRASIRILLSVPALLLAVPSWGRAQEREVRRCVSDTTRVLPAPTLRQTVDTIAPGVTYTCLLRPEGPWLLHIATIDLRYKGYAIDGVRAAERMVGRERVSAMVQRLTARGERPVVAINADFFDLGTGEVENNQVIRGQWVKGAVITDSPHDAFDNAHTQFAIDRRGGVHIGRFELHGAVYAGRGTRPLVGINYRPPHTEGLVLYTPWFGDRTLGDTLRDALGDPLSGARASAVRPRDPDAATAPRPAPSVAQLRADSARAASLSATRRAVEVALTFAGASGDTLRYRVATPRPRVGGASRISPRGAVLSATGDSAIAFLRALARRGGTVRVLAGLGVPTFSAQTSVGGLAAGGAGRRQRRCPRRFSRGDLPTLLLGAPSAQRHRPLARFHPAPARRRRRATSVERRDVAR